MSEQVSVDKREDNPALRSTVGPAFLSALLPGSGLFLIRKRTGGIVLLILFVICVSSFWPLRIVGSFGVWILVAWGLVILYVVSTWLTLRQKASELFKPASHFWLLLLIPLAVVAGVVVLRYSLGIAKFRMYTIPSPSMEPTILETQTIMVDLLAYQDSTPKIGDIIVLRREEDVGEVDVVKRVIAVGGQSVSGAKGVIFVNGEALDEPYVRYRPTGSNVEEDTFEPVLVPGNSVFAVGDNRDQSLDSRSTSFGAVSNENILGKVAFAVPALQSAHKL